MEDAMSTTRVGFRVLIVCLVFLAVIHASLAAPKSYPLVCKGGGEMEASFSHVKAKGGFHGTSLAIKFQKSRAAASSSEPAPGQCAWLDRPISAEEPSSLAYAPGAGQDFSFTLKGDKWTLADTEDEGLKHILNKMRRGDLFYLRCHREGGFLKVDHVGP
jgi:hypothetical protein